MYSHTLNTGGGEGGGVPRPGYIGSRYYQVLAQSPNCVRLLVTPCQAPLPMGVSRQEYQSGLHFLLQQIFRPRNGIHIFCISCIDW